MNFLLFLAPFSWGTQKREAAAPKASGCFMGGTCAVREEPGKQKPRSALCASRYGTAGAGIWPEQCPGKCAAKKGAHLLNSVHTGPDDKSERIRYRAV